MNPDRSLACVMRVATAAALAAVFAVAALMIPSPAHAAGNKKPVAVDDTKRIKPGKRGTIKVLCNDFDPDGSKIKLLRMGQPSQGKGRVKRNGTITYKPNADARGQDAFNYVIRDRNGKGKRAKGRVVVDLRSPGLTFAKLCAKDGVLMCEGFEDDLSAASVYQPAHNNLRDPHRPRINRDPEGVFQGCGSLQLTVNGANNQDVTGSVGYDFGPIRSGTFYVSMRLKFGDGLQAKIRADGFDGSKGMKHFQITEGPKSCTGNSINSSDSRERGAWRLTYTCGGMGWRLKLPNGDFNLQPQSDNDFRDYDDGACTFRHLSDKPGFNDPPPPEEGRCQILKDDTWHLHELEITIGGGVRWWVDGVQIINLSHADGADPPRGPYDHIRLINYMTGYIGGADRGRWRVWYDNLIVSRNCITSCGQ